MRPVELTVFSPKEKKYKCNKGHEIVINEWSTLLHFTLHTANKTIYTNPLCGECLVEVLNSNFTLMEVTDALSEVP